MADMHHVFQILQFYIKIVNFMLTSSMISPQVILSLLQ